MPDLTIPDSLAADLRDHLIANLPAGIPLTADRIRVRHQTEDPPCPRAVILAGDPQRQYGMDYTGKIPVEITYVTSKDRTRPDEHQLDAAALSSWWINLRATKRREVISTRVYLHDIFITPPRTDVTADNREQVTTIAGSLMVSLVDS